MGNIEKIGSYATSTLPGGFVKNMWRPRWRILFWFVSVPMVVFSVLAVVAQIVRFFGDDSGCADKSPITLCKLDHLGSFLGGTLGPIISGLALWGVVIGIRHQYQESLASGQRHRENLQQVIEKSESDNRERDKNLIVDRHHASRHGFSILFKFPGCSQAVSLSLIDAMLLFNELFGLNRKRVDYIDKGDVCRGHEFDRWVDLLVGKVKRLDWRSSSNYIYGLGDLAGEVSDGSQGDAAPGDDDYAYSAMNLALRLQEHFEHTINSVVRYIGIENPDRDKWVDIRFITYTECTALMYYAILRGCGGSGFNDVEKHALANILLAYKDRYNSASHLNVFIVMGKYRFFRDKLELGKIIDAIFAPSLQ